MAGYIQNEPVKYMGIDTLWNDRRDPHANPMSSSPRRMEARPSGKGLEGLLHFLYRPGLAMENTSEFGNTDG